MTNSEHRRARRALRKMLFVHDEVYFDKAHCSREINRVITLTMKKYRSHGGMAAMEVLRARTGADNLELLRVLKGMRDAQKPTGSL